MFKLGADHQQVKVSRPVELMEWFPEIKGQCDFTGSNMVQLKELHSR